MTQLATDSLGPKTDYLAAPVVCVPALQQAERCAAYAQVMESVLLSFIVNQRLGQFGCGIGGPHYQQLSYLIRKMSGSFCVCLWRDLFR